jgi:hypothetical protein
MKYLLLSSIFSKSSYTFLPPQYYTFYPLPSVFFVLSLFLGPIHFMLSSIHAGLISNLNLEVKNILSPGTPSLEFKYVYTYIIT